VQTLYLVRDRNLTWFF